jgi:hypothetical protein
VLDINQNKLFEFNTQITAAEDTRIKLLFVIDPDVKLLEVNERNDELRAAEPAFNN